MFKNAKLITVTAFCVCLTCGPVWAGGSVKDNIGQDRKILIDSKTLAGGTIRDGSGDGNKKSGLQRPLNGPEKLDTKLFA